MNNLYFERDEVYNPVLNQVVLLHGSLKRLIQVKESDLLNDVCNNGSLDVINESEV